MSEMGAVGSTRRLVGYVGPKLKKQRISGECILSSRRLTFMNSTAFFVAVQRNMITKWSKTQSNLTKKATSPLHMDGSVVFARLRQCSTAMRRIIMLRTLVHESHPIASRQRPHC